MQSRLCTFSQAHRCRTRACSASQHRRAGYTGFTCQADERRCVLNVWLRHTRTAPSMLHASSVAAYTALRCHMAFTQHGLAAAAAPGAAPAGHALSPQQAHQSPSACLRPGSMCTAQGSVCAPARACGLPAPQVVHSTACYPLCHCTICLLLVAQESGARECGCSGHRRSALW